MGTEGRAPARSDGATPCAMMRGPMIALDPEPVRPLLDDETDVRALYPYMAKVFGPDGWDDPEMDIYDELDPRRQS